MSIKMNIGLSLRQDASMPDLVRWCRDAEEAGFRWIGLADSQVLRREFYVCYAAFVLNTSRASFVPVVSNPATRHPSVAAGAMLSLYEMAPGRVSLGLGAGDSATYGVGLPMARVDYMRDYIRTVKGLLNGEEVTWQGKRFKAEWRDWQPPVPVKIYVAATGPRTIKMAAAEADGLIGGWGATEPEVQQVLTLVAEGAREAGRSPQELELWWCFGTSLAKSKEAAEEQMGVGVQFMVRGTMDGKGIPEHYKPALRRLYDAQYAGGFMVHGGDPGATGAELATHGRPNPELVRLARELGVWDWLVEHGGGLHGTPEDIQQGIQRLYDRGIRNLMLLPANAGLGQDKGAFARVLGKEVLPHFS